MKPKSKKKKFVGKDIELDDLHKDIIQDLIKASKTQKQKEDTKDNDRIKSRLKKKKVKNHQKITKQTASNDSECLDNDPETVHEAGGLFGKKFSLADCDTPSDPVEALLPVRDGKTKKEPEVIVFEDPEKRSKKSFTQREGGRDIVGAPGIPGADSNLLVSLRKAKFDVFKYYMDGIDPNKVEKEEARAQLAIQLGAKAAKPKHVSIKQYMEEKQLSRQQRGDTSSKAAKPNQYMDEKDGKQQRRDTSTKKRKSDARDKDRNQKRNKSTRYTADGQLGMYRDGVLHIPKQHLPPGYKKSSD